MYVIRFYSFRHSQDSEDFYAYNRSAILDLFEGSDSDQEAKQRQKGAKKSILIFVSQ